MNAREPPSPGLDEGGETSRDRPGWVEIAFAIGSAAIGAGLVALIPDMRHAIGLALQGDLDGLHRQLRGLGAGGVGLILGLMMLHAVLFYPTEIITATAGFVYGFLPGLALVTVGWVASALLAYLLGPTDGRPLAEFVFGRRRMNRLVRAVRQGGVPLLLALRLIPVIPFSLTGYVAGAAGVPVWRFSWTTLVGYLPLTVIVCYLGSEARSLSLSDPRVWVALVVAVALVAATRLVRWERAADSDAS